MTATVRASHRLVPVSSERFRGDLHTTTDGPIRGARHGPLVAAIETQQPSKRYGSTTAVQELDLEISEGEVYGYLGPNGAGKTTTIRLLLDCTGPPAGGRTCSGSTAGAIPSTPTAGSPMSPASRRCGRR